MGACLFVQISPDQEPEVEDHAKIKTSINCSAGRCYSTVSRRMLSIDRNDPNMASTTASFAVAAYTLPRGNDNTKFCCMSSVLNAIELSAPNNNTNAVTIANATRTSRLSVERSYFCSMCIKMVRSSVTSHHDVPEKQLRAHMNVGKTPQQECQATFRESQRAPLHGTDLQKN